MSRSNRTVADRLKALQPVSQETIFTLAAARKMYSGVGWPEIPNNQLMVNMVLAGVRAGRQTVDPIRKHVDQECLVTDDGRYVMMMPSPIVSVRLSRLNR